MPNYEHLIRELNKRMDAMDAKLVELGEKIDAVDIAVKAFIAQVGGNIKAEDLQPLIDRMTSLKAYIDAAATPTE